MGQQRKRPAAHAMKGAPAAVQLREDVTRRVDAALLDALLLAPALLPLLFIPGFLFPYASPKSIGLRSLGILLLAALVWLVLTRAPLHYGRLRQRLTWIPAALLAFAYAASLAGVGFHHSFWSSFERGDGLLTLTAEVLFFYAILLHADARFMRRFAQVSVWVSALVSLYALVQWADMALKMPIPALMKSPDRIGATFGNAAFMASYLGMSFFLTLWLARGCSRWTSVLLHGVAALQCLAILASGTRGTIVALFLCGVVAASHMAWRGQGRARQRARIVLVAAVALVALGALFRSQLAQVPIATVQRLAAISLTSGTSAVRLALWKSIGREALHHPVAGVGAEHVDYVYNKAYLPDTITGEWNDHSHNVYLDYFVQFGAPGLLLYLGLVLAGLYRSAAMHKAGESAGGYLFLLILTYAVQNFFVFDVALTLWMFLVVLALVLADPGVAPQRPRNARVPVAVAGALACPVLWLLVPVTIQPVRANMLIANAVSNLAGNPAQELQDVRRGLALDTYADLEYGYATYNMFVYRQEQQLSGPDLVLAQQLTQEVLAANFERYPYDVRTAVYLTHLIDRTAPGRMQDQALLEKAAGAVAAISPLRAAPWHYRANAHLRQADAAQDEATRNAHYHQAAAILGQYAQLMPADALSRYAIANLHLFMGDAAQARAWADAADAVYKDDVNVARAAAGYYISIQDWPKVARYLNVVAGNNMQDYPTVLDLAHARYMSGDRKGARELVDYLRRASPRTLASEGGFLQELAQE